VKNWNIAIFSLELTTAMIFMNNYYMLLPSLFLDMDQLIPGL